MNIRYFVLSTCMYSVTCMALEQLVGPSFADLDTHYRHTVRELKSAVGLHAWDQETINAFEMIGECTRNGLVSPMVCEHLDTLVRIKTKQSRVVGLKDLIDRAYSDALARSSYAVLSQLSMGIEHTLSDLEKERSYWLWCQANPWKYFLSKSPLTWFSGPKQKHQISENLQAIDQLMSDLYEQYGRLLRHKAAFTTCNDALQRYDWVQKAVVLLCSVVSYELLSFNQEASFAQAVCQLNALVDVCDRYIKTLQHRVYYLQRPSHMVRYWIPYTAATVGAASAWCYYRNNQDKVDGFINEKICDEYPALIRKNFKEEVSDKVKYLVDLFLKKPEKPDIAKMRQQLVDITHIVADVLDSIKNEGKKSLEGNIGLEQSIVKLRAIDIEPIKVSTWAGNAEVSNFQATIKEAIDVLSDLLSSANDNVKSVHILKIELADKLKSLIPICESMGIDAVNKAEFLTRMIDRNEVTSGMTAIFPAAFIAGLMTWTGYKSVTGFKHWLTKRDVRIIRARLSNIHDVLINAGASMTDEQYGTFIYCVHKLHVQAYKNVPYHHRDAFITHLKQLVSHELDVQQKKETVANMRATYEFLSPMFVA